MKRKLIILYTQFYDFKGITEKVGGIETYIKNLSNVAVKNNFEVYIIQYSDIPFEKQFSKDINVIGIKNTKKKNSQVLLKKAYEIGDINNDILLFASSHMNKKNNFKSSIAIQHGIYWDIDRIKGKKFPKFISTILKNFQIYLEINRNKLVNQIVCVDYNYINWYKALTIIENEKLTCIPNFTYIEEKSERKEKATVDIIFARRFERIRGTEIIVPALKKILNKYSYINFTFAGNGSEENKLREAFKENSNVKFITYLPSESIEIHKEYDIAIVPSIGSEGTSLSLLEAMSAGCCVISTNVGGMTNIIINNYNGLLVEPNESALYNAIEFLIQNKEERLKMSERGYDTVNYGFNLSNWTKKWEEIINGEK